MIEMLKNDDVINKVGGRFKLTALMQKRWVELMQGARPTVDATGKTPLEVIAQEVLEGKIAADFSAPSESEDGESDAAE
jgi:DNA-directed RNA polymerase subunit omega